MGERWVEVPPAEAGEQETAHVSAHKTLWGAAFCTAAETGWQVAYYCTFKTAWKSYRISWEIGCGAGAIFLEGCLLELYWTLYKAKLVADRTLGCQWKSLGDKHHWVPCILRALEQREKGGTLEWDGRDPSLCSVPPASPMDQDQHHPPWQKNTDVCRVWLISQNRTLKNRFVAERQNIFKMGIKAINSFHLWKSGLDTLSSANL